MRDLPKPKSTSNNTLFSIGFKSGVTVLRTSATGANAEIIKLNGDTTDFCSPLSFQTVFMEKLSLPTGMLTPKSWQISETACTVRYNFSSSPFTPQAAIQFADNLILPISPMFTAAIFVIASPIHIRPDAGASANATAGFSPIDMASPRCVLKPIMVTAQSAIGT